MSNLKIGVIGVGALGRHHARILAGLDGVELVAVADSVEANGRAAAEAWSCEWFANYREMLNKVEAVSIAVPTFAHREVAEACLSHNLPMMMEKPLAGNLSDARDIAEEADARGVTLQVGHVERFNPATQVALDLVDSPKYIRSQRISPFSYRSTDISIVHDLMIHDLDLILAANDSPVKHVQAFGIALFGDQEDAVQARLVFENGCIADVTASRISPVAGRDMQLWSAAGCIAVDFTTREVKQYKPGEALLNGPSPVELAKQPGADIEQLKDQVFGHFIEVAEADVPDSDALTAELAHFVDCVKTGKTPLVNGWTAVRALELADQIQQSVANHSWNGKADGVQGPFVLNRDDHKRKAA